jgi:hypothetical protein
MPLAFPVDAPGYLDLPGKAGNYAVITRTQLATPPATVQFTARVRLDSLAVAVGVGGWGSTHAYLMVNTNRTLFMRVLNVGVLSIGALSSSAMPTTAGVGVDVWVRGKVTIATAQCDYWYSLDGDNPTWIPLTGGVGSNAGTVPALTATGTVVLGSHSTGLAGMDGRLYYFAEHLDGVETIRFDGNQDLGGVVPTATSFSPSVAPVNSVVTVFSAAKAIGQGYATFPGTTGNYLETPDAAALDVTTAMYVILRMRQRDTVPNFFSVPVGKGLVYRVVTGPYGLLFSYGPNDSSYFRATSRTTIDANEQWVWYSIFYDPATGAHKVWYSLTDSLTPPVTASWTSSFSVTMGASTIGNSTAPLRIGSGWTSGSIPTGPSVNGDIGYVSIRTGTGALPVEGTEVFRLDADNFIGVDPSLTTSLTAGTGQALTVYRSAAPRGTGYVLFPGTLGNDLVVADAATLEITGPTSFVFGILPRTWVPYTDQTLISKWASAGQRSYAVMVDIQGHLQFLYSVDGTAYITLTCTDPMPASTNFQVFRIDTDIVGGVRVVDFYVSPDTGVTWSPLGTRQSGITGTVFNSTSPVVVGAEYDGRLYGLSIFGSSQNTATEMLRLASEHIPANPQAATLALQGGTATVRRSYVPVDFGFIILPGTEGNYLTVPDEVAFRDNTSFVVEARLIANDWTPPRRSRAIMTKSTGAVGGFGWSFLLSSRGTLMFYWSSNGNSYDNVVESPALGLQSQAAKRVAVSYEAGTGNYVRFWTSDDNRTWTRLSETPTSAAMFASTAQLVIGNFFDGAISNASFRTTFDPGGVPIQDTEALLIDQTSLAVDKAVSSFKAVTGQTVTVVRTQTAVEETTNLGYLYFPGTLGNYATVPAAGFGAISGSMTVDIRLAADRWTGQLVVDSTDPPTSHYEGPAQTLFGRWSAGNNHSYLVRLSPNGEFLFTWTDATGGVEYTSTSRPVPGPVNGEYRYFRLQMDMSVPSQQTLLLFETTDYGDNWVRIGQPIVTTYPTSGLVQGNGPFWIGATEGDTSWFGGRLADLRIYNDTTKIETFRMDQESLRKPDNTTVFSEQWGKTITLHQSSTPTISGYVSFDGVSGEYCRATVPNLSTVTSDFSVVVRMNFAGTLLATEQVILQKWNTTPASKVLNKQLTTNVATITTKAAHKLAVGNVVVVTGVGTPFDGTVTVVAVPTATTFTYAKTNANIASTASDGDVTPLGRSFSLRRKGNEISFHASMDGVTDDINAVVADLWDDEAIDWGWLAITTNYTTDGATVTFWTTPDALTPVGTPLVPLPTDWVAQGDPLFFDDITALYMDTEQVTFGGAEDGTLSMRGYLSYVSITNGVGTDNRPGGTEKFGWNINSFAGIAPDSGAFTAWTGENVVLEPVGSSRNMKIQPSAPGPTTDLEPSKPGPTTTIIPSPQGPTTTLVRGEDGPTTMLTASPVGPVTEIVTPSVNRPWWPGTEQDDTSKWWIQPAFTVQRTVEGQITGGDYVRGSTNTRTQQTAIRYPTTLPGWTPAGVGKGILYTQPVGYDTVEIEWNIPEQLAISWETPSTLADITWSEVAIVRASMGYPSTVNDGQAVMRMTKAQLFPNGYVYDTTNHQIMTPNQADPRPLDTSAGPGLTPGRWYYYGLFFRIGLDWVRSSIHCCLIPRNHHHSDHLWNGLPPYYRYLDDNMRGGSNDGDLKKWLGIFGYQFDMTREYVESMLDMYHTDFTPISLLRRIGENFGVKYEPGLGDYSYRALVGTIGFLYRGRGTVGGLKSLVNAAAKCDCDVTQSPNVLLLPDDSEFMNGTGNWAGIHDLTDPKPTGTGMPSAPVSYDKVFFTNGTYGYNPGPTTGKGMMHVYTAPADSTLDLLITCGNGKQAQTAPNPPLEILPFDVGTPCQPGDVFTFSINCASEFGVGSMQAFLMFFKKGGRPYDFISHASALGAATPTVGNWAQTSVSGTVPANGAFVVPAVAVVSRAAGSNTSRSPYVHFSGATLYYVGNATQVTSDVFIKTLTLTGPAPGHPGTETDTGAEIIGPSRASPLFDPFYLGEEQK